MNSAKSNNQSLKNLRFTSSGCKDKVMNKLQFVTINLVLSKNNLDDYKVIESMQPFVNLLIFEN